MNWWLHGLDVVPLVSLALAIGAVVWLALVESAWALRGRLWHSVPFGEFPSGVGEELQGLVHEFDPSDGRTVEVSLQAFLRVGPERRMAWDFGHRQTVSRAMYWVRVFWARPDCHATQRVRIGLGQVGVRWGCCPEVVYL